MVEPNTNHGAGARLNIKRIVVSRMQHGWLKAMGVDVPWIAANEPKAAQSLSPGKPAEVAVSEELYRPSSKPSVAAPVAKPEEKPPAPDVSTVDLGSFDLAQISNAVTACQRCGLCGTRQHAVPGDGVQKPTILIVGEAPGEQEDQRGKPFVGRSGQLLDNMLTSIGHGRDTSVYITNVVKCRPPANRNPRDEEIAACAVYLERQIELLAPKAILAMGRFAAHALLKTESPLQKLRETPHQIEVGGKSLPVVVTYHPAYLLRRPVDKRLAWDDLKRLRALVT